jgi:hypothetical protein
MTATSASKRETKPKPARASESLGHHPREKGIAGPVESYWWRTVIAGEKRKRAIKGEVGQITAYGARRGEDDC